MTILVPPRPAERVERPRLSRRADAVTLAVSLWLIIGLFVDGWAHTNLTALETFFTPWHALFYSGFLACAGWIGWQVVRAQDTGRRGPASVPVGYGLGIVGLGVFALGGAGDMAWHLAFGIEQDIAALFSPTHLALMTGIALIVTSPLRAAWSEPGDGAARNLWTFAVPLLSMTLLTSLVSFFFMYFSAFGDVTPTVVPTDEANGDSLLGFGIASALVTNLILVASMLYLLRRWELPFGAMTVMFTVVAVLVNAITAFMHAETIVPAVVGGLLADVALRTLRPTPERPHALRAVAALAPLALWSAYYLTLDLATGLVWPREITSGLVVYNALAGVALAQLVLAKRVS